ncbi:D-alanyl-D-alanine carboxypeptidase DacB [Weizmannia acidilactici]|uniref:serine-type D-Ala-D-Ala carboxypeptidase n=1 Tax=Weizmannia acidilactici TaxID=2607726 RepID=A0A5J4JG55_9BACI|nr:D-alanyl-D-alanine carboxypeptidase family protein [Weizmannia acidilactici]GER66067.1 D-alanyl-D-alanine carboxypeptidase DacB [Weizmannia acidilactici]GER69298.1 D-alanyl-D-alanine carboxypeptidase DacB [Weizmannia acidilactici]GER72376.1 D-alanyl-D-alanine carboxypeptidase DacB [Weizmannia acidilactici]
MKRLFFYAAAMMLIFSAMPPESAEAAPSVQAKSAILMDQDTGRILYEKGAYEPRSIASITKIMTAILAIESGKMDKEVTVTDRAVRTEGSSLYLKPGDKWKLKDLVYGLMLRSGNDAANAIAENVGGSIDGFVFMMNEKAREIGMRDTHFANPSGLDDPDGEHYSTAYDMVLLMRYAMQNKTFREISGTKFYKGWRNKNRLLTEKYRYCTGGKTGYTKIARRTLVTTASKDGQHLIAVTLNDPDDWDDHIALFDYGFSHYGNKLIVEKGPVAAIRNKFFKNHVYIKRNIVYPLARNEEDGVKVDFRLAKPKKEWKDPENVPQIVGRAVVTLDNRVISSTPIYYKKTPFKERKTWYKLFKETLFIQLGLKNYG